MKLSLEEANLISIFIRRIKPDKTYEDFRKAWYPDKGFGIPVRVINSVNSNDEKEIFSIGLMKLPEDKIEETLKQINNQESIRHNRIADVIESTQVKGIFRIMNDDDLS